MREIVVKLLAYLKSGVVVIVSATGGWFGSNYMSDRAAYKEALQANYAQFDAVSAEISDSLKDFAAIAVGKKAKTPEDADRLQSRLLKGVTVVEDLQRRLNDATWIEQYETAAVKLKAASDKVTGPADAKPLVLAVSDYLVADKTVRDAVIEEHNRFLF